MASNQTFGFPAKNSNSNFSGLFGRFRPKIAMFSIIQNISFTKVAGNKKVIKKICSYIICLVLPAKHIFFISSLVLVKNSGKAEKTLNRVFLAKWHPLHEPNFVYYQFFKLLVNSWSLLTLLVVMKSRL